MFRIRDRKDLELAYSYLKLYEEIENENPEADKKAVIEIKREIRRYLRLETGHKIVKDFSPDGYIELVELPEQLETQEDAEQYFNENLWIHYYPTYYDCTGQLFTGWVKVFRRRGRYMAYHAICKDI